MSDDSGLGRLLGGLRHRDYAVLLTTYLVTQTGFWLSTVALQWQTGRLTGNDPFLLGLLYFCNLVPLLILSPVGGTLADRLDRRRLVIAGQIATATLAGILVTGLTTAGPSLWLLFAFAVGIGAAMALMGPANSALMVNAVPVDDLRSAISLQSASMNVARMIGPAIAGGLLATYGAWSAFSGYLVTSIVAALALMAVRVAPIEVEEDHARLLRRVKAGIQHARERRPAGPALLLVAVNAFLGSSYVPMLTVFAFDVLDGDDAVFTLFFVISGVGALLGAISNGVRSEPLTIRGALVVSLTLGAGLMVFATSRSVVLSAAALLVVALANFAVMTALNVVVQTVVDESQRGRVMSLYIVAWGGLVPLGSLSVGIVASLVGAVAAVLVYGTLLLLAAVAGLVWYRPEAGELTPAVR